jgi:hypothetical protein
LFPVAARKEYLFDVPVTLEKADKRRPVGGTGEADKRRRLLVDFDDVIGNNDAGCTEISAAATTEISLSTASDPAGPASVDSSSKFLAKANRCSHLQQLQQQQHNGQCLT